MNGQQGNPADLQKRIEALEKKLARYEEFIGTLNNLSATMSEWQESDTGLKVRGLTVEKSFTATTLVESTDLATDAVTTEKIKNEQVTTDKIAKEAVKEDQLTQQVRDKLDQVIARGTSRGAVSLHFVDVATDTLPKLGAQLIIGGSETAATKAGFRITRNDTDLLSLTDTGDLDVPGSLKVGGNLLSVTGEITEGGAKLKDKYQPKAEYQLKGNYLESGKDAKVKNLTVTGELKIGDVTITVEPVELFKKQVFTGNSSITIRRWFLAAPCAAPGRPWETTNHKEVALVVRKTGQPHIILSSIDI